MIIALGFVSLLGLNFDLTVLAGLMLVGRLEFVTVLALFHPMFWRWR